MPRAYNQAMDSMPRPEILTDDDAYAAFGRRDRAFDGRVIGAVRTTGIYCRPSCPARRPKRENMLFFPDVQAARAAGFRPCLRCRPDEEARDRVAVARAVARIEAASAPVPLDMLAREVGYAPHHFHRLFKRAMGVTPAAYARALRARRVERALTEETRVTDAVYAAGFAAPSRFYADAAERLGMTPGTWRAGGEGMEIFWTVAQTSLGPLLIAATPRGLCRIAFDEGEAMLAARFPGAQILPGGVALSELARRVMARVEAPGMDDDLPRDVRGTAFQQAVWEALRAIPPGETRSYARIAAMAGRPDAVRAAGSACGANPLAVVVPCHRVLRSDGGLGGYAYGIARKQALLEREGVRQKGAPDGEGVSEEGLGEEGVRGA